MDPLAFTYCRPSVIQTNFIMVDVHEQVCAWHEYKWVVIITQKNSLAHSHRNGCVLLIFPRFVKFRARDLRKVSPRHTPTLEIITSSHNLALHTSHLSIDLFCSYAERDGPTLAQYFSLLNPHAARAIYVPTSWTSDC